MSSTNGVARLRHDIESYPDSEVLEDLAVRDATGAVVGMRAPSGDVLGWAYLMGAPAHPVVAAERRRAMLRKMSYRDQARFAFITRRLNEALAGYIDGRQALPSVVVLLAWYAQSPLVTPPPATTEVEEQGGALRRRPFRCLDPPGRDEPSAFPISAHGPPCRQAG